MSDRAETTDEKGGARRVPNPCCVAKVPSLDPTRQDGADWTCSLCGSEWVYVIEESEGAAWWPRERWEAAL